ncbi:MAG: hypothetical protein GY927_22495, partial [bacterium]|nr:hypothetical protein [bacterium]
SEPGAPDIPWRRWKIQFDVYKNRKSANYRLQYGLRNQVEADANQAVRTAAAAAETAFVDAIYSDRHKNEDLFAFLGREGQRQFLAMPDGENFDRPHTAVLTALDRIFMPPVNRIIAMQKFRSRRQGEHELATAYETELRALAADCGFAGDLPNNGGSWEDFEIATMLKLHCRDKELQQKLFAEHSDSQLTAVLNCMRAHESAQSDVKTVRRATGASVNAVQEGNDKPAGNSNIRKKRTPQQHKSEGTKSGAPKANQNSGNHCTACNRKGHKIGSSDCPARDKTCNACQGKGHFSPCCPSKLPSGKKKMNMIRIP